MMPEDLRVLYQFPLSHYCEKARWLLDFKELDYVAQNLTPGLHIAFTQMKTGQHLLPILKDQGSYIADSSKIALYLDQRYPEHPLLPKDRLLADKAIQIDQIASRLGIHVRRWGLGVNLQHSDDQIEIMLGEKGYLRNFERFAKPLLKTLVKKNYKLQPEAMAASKTHIDDVIQQLNAILVENGGRYLVAEQLGFADISVCSMLAPMLNIAGTPWEVDHVSLLHPEHVAAREALLRLPLGQYVQRVYDNERHARIDWRGI